MTHLAEDELIAYALGDAEEETVAAVESHASSCHACRAEIEALRQVLDLAADAPVPERASGYGAEVWARLEPRLPESPRHPTSANVWRGWLAAAAGLLIVAGAFLAGRWTRGPVPVGTVAPAPAARSAASAPDRQVIRERVVLAALGDHLDRTERGLVELVNTDVEGTVDIGAEQTWARDLLDANRLYRLSARGAAPPALTQLLDELEPVLLAIVHGPSRLTPREFNALRERIQDRSLVFKLRVTGADVRAREKTLRHSGDPTS